MTELNNNKSSFLPAINNFESYKKFVLSIPNMEEDEERELITIYKENDCLESASKLIMPQLKNVIYVANQYKNYKIPQEDLVQEGNIGLMKSIKNYNHQNYDVRLYTYSNIWIKSEIQAYIMKNLKLVKVATTNNLKKLFFNFRKTQKEMIDLGVPKSELYSSLMNTLNVSEEEVKIIDEYFGSDVVVLNNEKDDDEKSFIIEIEDNTNVELEHQVINDNELLKKVIMKSLHSLNDREKVIIENKFYNENPKTNKELGVELGISSERVRQIENAAIKKMKGFVEKERVVKELILN